MDTHTSTQFRPQRKHVLPYACRRVSPTRDFRSGLGAGPGRRRRLGSAEEIILGPSPKPADGLGAAAAAAGRASPPRRGPRRRSQPPPAARLCSSATTGGWVAAGGRKEARQGRLASGRSATLADGSRPRPAPHARPAARRRTRRAVSGSRAALSSGAAAEAEQAGQLVAVRRRQLEPRRRLRHDACRAPTGRWPQLLRAA